MKVLKYVLRMQGTIENCKKEIKWKTITKKPKDKTKKKHNKNANVVRINWNCLNNCIEGDMTAFMRSSEEPSRVA